MSAHRCPPDSTLTAYGCGHLPASSADTVRAHLTVCPGCSARLTSLATDPTVLPGKSPTARGTAQTAPLPLPAAGLPAGLAGLTQYEDVRELGRGGMGVVYLAHNRLLDRPEVLKVVGREHLHLPGAKERFLREMQAAARLQHPNVVTAYAAVEAGDGLVFAMEYVPGDDLAKVVRRSGPLPVAVACFYAAQVAQGLQNAADKGMVHRDIKPANLILARDGRRTVVKILDFGLAKVASERWRDGGLTGAGQMMGTPDYMAPEQAQDAARADIRADVYALGCTLYHLLTGHPPLPADGLTAVLLRHQSEVPPPLDRERADVPPPLAAVVARMLAKRPADRPQSPGEVAKALKAFITPGASASPGTGVAAPLPLPPSQAAPTVTAVPLQVASAKPLARPSRPLPPPPSSPRRRPEPEDDPPRPSRVVRRGRPADDDEDTRPPRRSRRGMGLPLLIAGGVFTVIALCVGGLTYLYQLGSSRSSATSQAAKPTSGSQADPELQKDFRELKEHLGQFKPSLDFVQPRAEKRYAAWKAAAEGGEADAMFLVARCLDSGTGVGLDEAEAAQWYRKAADRGHAPSMNNLGHAYEMGIGVNLDQAEAVWWYRKGAEVGHPLAMYNLAKCYERGIGGVGDPFDPDRSAKVFDWYRKAAEAGLPVAMTPLGECHFNGTGVTKNEFTAVEWYRKAASAGDAAGMNRLGECLRDATGVWAKDEQESFRWFKKAADLGNVNAMDNVGWSYQHALGVTLDYPEAFRWFKQAADAGHVNAMNNVGFCYDNGRGVEADAPVAFSWYKQAADAGYAMSMYNVGRCYEIGRGVMADLEEAVWWYRAAADKGYEPAKKRLKELGK